MAGNQPVMPEGRRRAGHKLPRLVIAGTASGVGKTTIATGIMAALAKRGLAVQGFKAGPDYIDPGFHAAATGRPGRNLDTWLMDDNLLLELFDRAAPPAGVAIIEGVMGLYDGYGPRDDRGSTAYLAKVLDAPVILVVDGSGVGRSAAASVLGFQGFDRDVHLSGVIFNGLGGETHYQLLKEAIESATGVPVLGYLFRDEKITLPERHLGLVPAWERRQGPGAPGFLDRLTVRIESGIQLETLLRIAGQAPPLPPYNPGTFGPPVEAFHVNLAVARDEAFNFYYHDGLDYLEHLGASLVPFSPLADSRLPPGIDGIYIGGGFPEIFARDLAANRSLKRQIKEAAARGTPVYGECGGLMYLSQGITDREGSTHPMVGLVPGAAAMCPRLVGLGYVEARAEQDNLLARPGEVLKGHEFHWSELTGVPAETPYAYRCRKRRGREYADGLMGEPNTLATYFHVHLAAETAAARRLLNHCLEYRRRRADGGEIIGRGGGMGE